MADANFTGGCDCGLVRFSVTGNLGTVSACNCSVCTKKGYLHLIVEREAFRMETGEAALTIYRFGTSVAQHLFCARCGVAPFHVPRSDPEKIDVNVRCLDGVDLAKLQPVAFNGRHWEEAKRARDEGAAPS